MLTKIHSLVAARNNLDAAQSALVANKPPDTFPGTLSDFALSICAATGELFLKGARSMVRMELILDRAENECDLCRFFSQFRSESSDIICAEEIDCTDVDCRLRRRHILAMGNCKVFRANIAFLFLDSIDMDKQVSKMYASLGLLRVFPTEQPLLSVQVLDAISQNTTEGLALPEDTCLICWGDLSEYADEEQLYGERDLGVESMGLSDWTALLTITVRCCGKVSTPGKLYGQSEQNAVPRLSLYRFRD